MGVKERIEMAVLIEKKILIDELESWFDNLWEVSSVVDDEELLLFLKSIQKIGVPEVQCSQTLKSKTPKLQSKTVNAKNKLSKKTLSINFSHLTLEYKIKILKESEDYQYVEGILDKKEANEILERNNRSNATGENFIGITA